MKKTLDAQSITRELREHSAFFREARSPRAGLTHQAEGTRPSSVAAQAGGGGPSPSRGVDYARFSDIPHERRLRRHAFDIYDDQLQRLRRLKPLVNLYADNQGLSEVSLARMVRDAIDAYIATRAQELQTNDDN